MPFKEKVGLSRNIFFDFSLFIGVRGIEVPHKVEYCDTLQSKDRRNREYKVCLNVGAILRLLDNLEQNAQRPPAKIAREFHKKHLCFYRIYEVSENSKHNRSR